jgi:GT2 family glycosyltransferase
MEAYGNDDGDMINRIRRAGARVVLREHIVWHVAHTGTQDDWFAREDHWGRSTGFNPRNHDHNRQYVLPTATPWHTLPESEQWGKP